MVDTDLTIANVGALAHPPMPLPKARILADEFAKRSVSDATRKVYQQVWRDFQAWCAAQGTPSLPAEPAVVAAYISDLAVARDFKVATLSKILSGISEAHKLAGFPSPRKDPQVVRAYTGIRKTLGVPQKQMDAVTLDILRKMLDTVPRDDLKGIRDRAILLIGIASSFRRTNIAHLRVQDMAWVPEGLRITLPRSKTDQEGKGHTVGIPYGAYLDTCPVRNLKAWLDAAEVTTGYVFRFLSQQGRMHTSPVSDAYVWRVVKRAAEAAGVPGLWGGHSLRAGHVTIAYGAGERELVIRQQTGHKSLQMLAKYLRSASLFKENSAAKLGL